MRNLSLILFTKLTFAVLPAWCATLHWGGGSGNWTGNSNWYTSADLSGSPQVWSDHSDAVVESGTPHLNTSIQADSLHLADVSRITFGGGRTLRVNGAVTGSGRLDISQSSESGLYIHSALDQSVTVGFRVPQPSVPKGFLRIGGTGRVTYNGHILASGNRFIFYLDSGAELQLGPQASINNNQTDLINARNFLVIGSGLSSRILFHPEFNADLADPAVTESIYPYALPEDDPGDGSYVKPVGGLSTVRFENVSVQTGATQNLATIHKYTGGSQRYTHHGLWMVDRNNGPVQWTVSGAAQEYDGGIYYNQDWTLETQTDYDQAAKWHDGVNVGFGTRTNGTTLTKTGAADFILSGTQAYHPGSSFHVTEGGLVFLHDPDITSTPNNNGYMVGTGNHLILNVDSPASTSFLPPEGETFRFHSGNVQGTLVIQVQGGTSGAHVQTASDVSVSGPLQIPYTGTLSQAEYLLLDCGGTLTYSPSSVQAPPGWQVETSGNQLWLRPDGTPRSYADWAAAELAGETQTGALEDPFSQNLTNLARYAIDLEPGQPVPATAIPHWVRTSEGLQLRYQRAAPSRRPDVVYTLQYRTDLMSGTWTDLPDSVGTVVPNGDIEILTFSPSALPDENPLYLRVQLELL